MIVVVTIGDGTVAMDFRSAKPTAFETVCTLAVAVLTIGLSPRNLQRQDADSAIDRAPA
ncbi:MAG TPA: hypothetical protein VMK83_05720 [Gaiellaceae bacterium]|nr:hypothetical protein [Gaiellaceae bacterium]